MSKFTKALIAFLLMSCLLITAVPAFAADDEIAEEAVESAEEIGGYAYLSVDFEGLDEVPFTGNNVENLSVADGVFSGTSTGDDPHTPYTPGVDFPADKVDYIIIKLDAESESSAFQFFFTTDSIGWSEAASFKYDFAEDEADEDGYVTIVLETATCTEWKGTITGFRLDPFSATGTFAFDSIVFWSTDTNIATVNFADYDEVPFGPSGDVVQMFVEDGYLYGESAGGDPYMNFTGTFGLNASHIGAINFRMKAFSESSAFQFFFTTETIGWSEAASFKVDLSECRKDAFGWIYVEIDTSVCAEWKGTITNFRLDPFSSVGVFKFSAISFDAAVAEIPEAPEAAVVIAPPKVPAPVFDYGIMLYFLFDDLPVAP
ncbi:MAG: hypothetical protein PHZ09_01050 [Eubacteriales bacterium]|jgi:hypothetical protein|nr:hypothetical protein [Eubacteriales bacterium]